MDSGHKIIGQLIGHIQTPSVCTGPEPAANDRILSTEDKFPVIRIMFVDGRERINSPPAFVVIRPVLEIEPGAIGGLLALFGTQIGIVSITVEVTADKAGVIASLPAIIVYCLFSERVEQAMTVSGAVKG